eukprot:scaffold600_cov193-Ochromonas_danica.AAC.7
MKATKQQPQQQRPQQQSTSFSLVEHVCLPMLMTTLSISYHHMTVTTFTLPPPLLHKVSYGLALVTMILTCLTVLMGLVNGYYHPWDTILSTVVLYLCTTLFTTLFSLTPSVFLLPLTIFYTFRLVMSSEVFDRVQGILTSWVVIVLVISYHGEDLLGDGSTTTITSLMMALALGLLGVITYHYLYHYLGHHYLDHYRYDVLHLLQLLSGHIYLMLFIYLLVFHLDLPMLAMTYLPGRHSVVFTVFTVVVRTAILFQIGLMIRSWVERRYPTPPPATTTK